MSAANHTTAGSEERVSAAAPEDHRALMLLAASDLESWMKAHGRDGATEDTVKRLRDAALATSAPPPAEAVPPPEFQEVSWGVDSVMRPCTGMAVSEFSFRRWAEANGIVIAATHPKEPTEGAATSPATATPAGSQQ